MVSGMINHTYLPFPPPKICGYEFLDSMWLTLVLGVSPSVSPGGGHHYIEEIS